MKHIHKAMTGWTLAVMVMLPAVVAIDAKKFFPAKSFALLKNKKETVKVVQSAPPQKTTAELVQEAYEKSKNVKGVYMTSLVAGSTKGAGKTKRDTIVKLLDETELNAVVIDVKEVNGSELTPAVVEFVKEMKSKGVWTIARLPLMRDSSQTEKHPEWYLTHLNGGVWRDKLGHAWLNPALPEVRTYLFNFTKTILDSGFDEIQFDYIRYPSDGNLKTISPASLPPAKSAVIDEAARELVDQIKIYKPTAIVSADLFGYIALLKEDKTIGQKLDLLGKTFDYISLMVYPSHFYAGLSVPADPARGLPALSYKYGVEPERDVVAHPYDVIFRTTLASQDIVATSSGKALMRPFLQDFNLAGDRARGISYGPERVRAQIEGAQDAGASGWLMWNASNNYTTEAFKKE